MIASSLAPLSRLCLAVLAFAALASPLAAAPRAPNVLLIILDDQNGYAGRTDVAPVPVTPNLDRLAARGLRFTSAQCAAPVCNPSRTALLSGLRPATSGIYDNSQDALPDDHILNRATPLPLYFREHDFLVAGAGKVFGSALGSGLKNRVWQETMPRVRGGGHGPVPPKEQRPLNGLGKHEWGAFPESREEMEDWKLAGWAAEFLVRPGDRPFFLACGIVKPHTPWYVPREYFDLFPQDKITVPDLAADELAGLPAAAREKPHKTDAEMAARRKEFLAAYFASSRYADDCVGRILAALEKSPHRDDTVVVVCGDNGYQFGEKATWSKGRLWEGSTNVPLVIAGPGIVRGQVCTRPVSLLDLYPTLLDLTGLPPRQGLEGESFVRLLKDPAASWDRPALTTAGRGNHALRTERWRYIRYADGSEELYDRAADPLERHNLAALPEHAAAKQTLQQSLPKTDAPRYPDPKDGKDKDD